MNSEFLVVAHFLLCGCRNWHLIKQDNYKSKLHTRDLI